MFIEKIQKLLIDHSAQSAMHFEALILELLALYFKQQGKPLTIPTNSESQLQSKYDALAPEGFDDFEGPTLIATELTGRYQALARLINRIISPTSLDSDLVNVLIICSRPAKPETLKSLGILFSNSRIKSLAIWGPEQIDKIASAFPQQMDAAFNSIFQLTIRNTLAHSSDDWKVKRDQNLARLSEAYDKSQFSIFLGAGVSASAGMPDWGKLLNSLFVSLLTKQLNGRNEIIEDDIPELVKRVNRLDDLPALLSARYLRRGLSKSDTDDSLFIDAVRNNLYDLRNENFDVASLLLRSIASLCTPQRTGAKVHSIVTYNFDDL